MCGAGPVGSVSAVDYGVVTERFGGSSPVASGDDDAGDKGGIGGGGDDDEAFRLAGVAGQWDLGDEGPGGGAAEVGEEWEDGAGLVAGGRWREWGWDEGRVLLVDRDFGCKRDKREAQEREQRCKASSHGKVRAHSLPDRGPGVLAQCSEGSTHRVGLVAFRWELPSVPELQSEQEVSILSLAQRTDQVAII